MRETDLGIGQHFLGMSLARVSRVLAVTEQAGDGPLLVRAGVLQHELDPSASLTGRAGCIFFRIRKDGC